MIDNDREDNSDHNDDVPVTKKWRRYNWFRMPNKTITIPNEESEHEESDQAGLSGDEESSYQSSDNNIIDEEKILLDDEEISAELFTTPEFFIGLDYDSE